MANSVKLAEPLSNKSVAGDSTAMLEANELSVTLEIECWLIRA